MMRTKKLALLGFGNAGQAFLEMLMKKQDDIREKYGYEIIVTATTDLMKTVSIVEHQPEIEQIAYGVFGDLLRVLSE